MADDEKESKTPIQEELDLMAPQIGEIEEGGEEFAVPEEEEKKKAPEKEPVEVSAKKKGEPDYESMSPEELVKELRKAEKDRNRMGHSLRQLSEQFSFVQDQINQERAKMTTSDLEKKRDQKIREIQHLKEDDPDLYYNQREQIIEDYWKNKNEEEKRISTSIDQTTRSNQQYQAVNMKLVNDFPDIEDEDSELFAESKKILFERYSRDEAAQVAKEQPKVFYSIVSEAAKNLKIAKIESGQVNRSREQRVKGQGVIEPVKKPGKEGSAKLTPQQMKFCKDHGYDPAKYAKFIGV